MHTVMWIFWGSIVTLVVGSYLVDIITGRKYNFKEQEKSLDQNFAEADSFREVDRYNHQNGSF
ncbi:hypothetical protein [Psychrobacillus sp. FJAT-21963]|uniref:hypothetical protein n=1 Tax=Psychrobacillus sp. FJAT-21963 TaxID=1712028 RepID=UPI0007018B90|nr:hypothetical protein [Psychrobacillus sp. FJAT-21963]KQL37210.1 hypothetical protein AN959_04050 [Psychrobacillus sp. FJAT-21963]